VFRGLDINQLLLRIFDNASFVHPSISLARRNTSLLDSKVPFAACVFFLHSCFDLSFFIVSYSQSGPSSFCHFFLFIGGPSPSDKLQSGFFCPKILRLILQISFPPMDTVLPSKGVTLCWILRKCPVSPLTFQATIFFDFQFLA